MQNIKDTICKPPRNLTIASNWVKLRQLRMKSHRKTLRRNGSVSYGGNKSARVCCCCRPGSALHTHTQTAKISFKFSPKSGLISARAHSVGARRARFILSLSRPFAASRPPRKRERERERENAKEREGDFLSSVLARRTRHTWETKPESATASLSTMDACIYLRTARTFGLKTNVVYTETDIEQV